MSRHYMPRTYDQIRMERIEDSRGGLRKLRPLDSPKIMRRAHIRQDTKIGTMWTQGPLIDVLVVNPVEFVTVLNYGLRDTNRRWVLVRKFEQNYRLRR